MGKAAAAGVAFLGVICILAALLFVYIGMVTWAVVAGQYFIVAILLFVIGGFLLHKANKIRRKV